MSVPGPPGGLRARHHSPFPCTRHVRSEVDLPGFLQNAEDLMPPAISDPQAGAFPGSLDSIPAFLSASSPGLARPLRLCHVSSPSLDLVRGAARQPTTLLPHVSQGMDPRAKPEDDAVGWAGMARWGGPGRHGGVAGMTRPPPALAEHTGKPVGTGPLCRRGLADLVIWDGPSVGPMRTAPCADSAMRRRHQPAAGSCHAKPNARLPNRHRINNDR
jgi:hypothetical protein